MVKIEDIKIGDYVTDKDGFTMQVDDIIDYQGKKLICYYSGDGDFIEDIQKVYTQQEIEGPQQG